MKRAAIDDYIVNEQPNFNLEFKLVNFEEKSFLRFEKIMKNTKTSSTSNLSNLYF